MFSGNKTRKHSSISPLTISLPFPMWSTSIYTWAHLSINKPSPHTLTLPPHSIQNKSTDYRVRDSDNGQSAMWPVMVKFCKRFRKTNRFAKRCWTATGMIFCTYSHKQFSLIYFESILLCENGIVFNVFFSRLFFFAHTHTQRAILFISWWTTR